MKIFNMRLRPFLRSFLYLLFIFVLFKFVYWLIFRKLPSGIVANVIEGSAVIVSFLAAGIFNYLRTRKLTKKA